MYSDQASALAAADESADVRCVLFEGAGGAFIAGNDLNDFAANRPRDPAIAPVFRFHHALVGFSKPLLAAVDGLAIGVGSTMLLHCDLVIASDRVRFAIPFVNFALVPEAGSSVLLAERVGAAKANEWFLLGEPIDAAEAERSGLVTKVLPQAELAAYAWSRAELLATKPPEAVRMTEEAPPGPEARGHHGSHHPRVGGLHRAPPIGRGEGAVRRVPLPRQRQGQRLHLTT